jgi:CTP:molybdopterin cytidylyltransferase MocA
VNGEPGAALDVDVVINNHNYAPFLGAAIESACAQTHERVNVIVVDDGSSDDSRELLRGYESRVTVMLKENGGQASALNAGIAECHGDVVMFLDADDTLLPDAASRVAATFAANPGLAKVQFRTEIVDAAGTPTGVIRPAPHLPMPEGDMRAAELAHPFDIVWMSTSANAFRRALLRRIFPIPERDYPTSGADWYLVHLSALLGPVASLDRVCARYRVHGDNSFELSSPDLDLGHVRQAIAFARPTAAALLRLAEELGLAHPARILSTADLANRLVSLRLEPALHPIPADSARRLAGDGIRAAGRRADVSPAMRVVFTLWFLAMGMAPRPLARRLAILFLFPERRASVNRILGRLHRDHMPTTPARAQ